MNNNFWFNYEKQNEKNNEEPLVEIIKEEVNVKEIKNNNNNLNKNKKENNPKSALIKLLVGFGIMLILIIFLNINNNSSLNTNKENNNDANNNNTKEEDNTNDQESQNLNVKDSILNGDYTYKYTINIIKNEEEINYIYEGVKTKEKTTGTLTKEENQIFYIYENNEYYVKDEEDKYVLTTEEEIFDIIDYKYLNISTIDSYISKSTLDYKTEYSNKTLLKGYNAYIKDIIISENNDEYITIVTKENENYGIEIDYTNLMKVINEEISSCKITLEYQKISNDLTE